MNLTEFLRAESVSKKGLAEVLGISSQSLYQFEQRKSNKFLHLMNTYYPKYLTRYDNDAYVFELREVQSDTEHQAPTLQFYNRADLLRDLSSTPVLYSLVASSQSRSFEVYFKTPANDTFCIVADEVQLGTFPSESYVAFSSLLAQKLIAEVNKINL